MNKKNIYLPILLALAVSIGIILGTNFERNATSEGDTYIYSKSSAYSKLNQVLDILSDSYVENINAEELSEKLLPKIMDELDPHSAYIPKDEVKEANESLEGSFSGIGVQFNIQNDTVMIVDVISGGPSEKLGIMPGDRIISVDDSIFTGDSINNTKVVKTLRGDKGSKVKVGIKRTNTTKELYFLITRGDIPLNSVDIAYPITNKTGYIKVSRFGANTHQEFKTGLNVLKRKGCKNFIVDLRYNSGGYLSAAINMINEFLPNKSLIVYTQGRDYPREEAFANGNGQFSNNKICILINEWSASASEIFAGAIQDQDRGWIIGRRSFGKGLVQQQIPLNDGSELRLTIAHYYTPSGRCIQKPYERGNLDGYSDDILNRYENGEFFAQDSINIIDSVEYKTRLGRTVYSHGGITPDYFIAQDTSKQSKYYMNVFNQGLIYNFAFHYADKNRTELSKNKNWKTLSNKLTASNYFNEFILFAEKKGVNPVKKDIKLSRSLIENDLQSYISRNILGEEGFYPILNSNDTMIKKALEVIETEVK